MKERFCTPDYELLTVGLRPYYLPREFNQMFVMVVYVQPRAHFQVASEAIASRIQRLESTSPDSTKFVLGDFNHCRLDQVLPPYTISLSTNQREGTQLWTYAMVISHMHIKRGCVLKSVVLTITLFNCCRRTSKPSL